MPEGRTSIEDFATRDRIYRQERARRERAAQAAGLLDIPKTNADTPERKALIAIIQDCAEMEGVFHNNLSAYDVARQQHETLSHITSLALRALREGAAL